MATSSEELAAHVDRAGSPNSLARVPEPAPKRQRLHGDVWLSGTGSNRRTSKPVLSVRSEAEKLRNAEKLGKLRQRLQRLSLGALKEQAKQDHVSQDELEQADYKWDPKKFVIHLIIKALHNAFKRQMDGKDTDEQPQEKDAQKKSDEKHENDKKACEEETTKKVPEVDRRKKAAEEGEAKKKNEDEAKKTADEEARTKACNKDGVGADAATAQAAAERGASDRRSGSGGSSSDSSSSSSSDTSSVAVAATKGSLPLQGQFQIQEPHANAWSQYQQMLAMAPHCNSQLAYSEWWNGLMVAGSTASWNMWTVPPDALVSQHQSVRYDCPSCGRRDCRLVGGREPCGQLNAQPGVQLSPLLAKRECPSGEQSQREVRLMNLTPGHAGKRCLREHFSWLFSLLPDCRKRYKKLMDVNGNPLVVVNVRLLEAGSSGFVEFVDDVLATTALLMDGFELHGRQVFVRRPRHYVVPLGGVRAPLNTEILRSRGLLPELPELSARPEICPAEL